MTLLENIIAVEVPEGQSYFDIYGNQWEQELCWNEMPKRGKFEQVRIPLPKGNWQFLFCTADASEEQAQMIMGDGDGDYLDYVSGFATTSTAKLSLQSLLSSKGLKKNYAVLKKII